MAQNCARTGLLCGLDAILLSRLDLTPFSRLDVMLLFGLHAILLSRLDVSLLSRLDASFRSGGFPGAVVRSIWPGLLDFVVSIQSW